MLVSEIVLIMFGQNVDRGGGVVQVEGGNFWIYWKFCDVVSVLVSFSDRIQLKEQKVFFDIL